MDRLARGRAIEKAAQLVEIDAGQHLARRDFLVAVRAQRVCREAAFAPEPHLAHGERIPAHYAAVSSPVSSGRHGRPRSSVVAPAALVRTLLSVT